LSWFAVACAAAPAWGGGPKVIALVQDGVMVEGLTALPPAPVDKFRSVTLPGTSAQEPLGW